MQKAAIVVLADPKSGSEESLGRLFNALAAAYDFKRQNMPVTLLFQGAGTRWAGELVNPGASGVPIICGSKRHRRRCVVRLRGCIRRTRRRGGMRARSDYGERSARHKRIAESGSFGGRRVHRADILIVQLVRGHGL
jgi:hypothetical protein